MIALLVGLGAVAIVGGVIAFYYARRERRALEQEHALKDAERIMRARANWAAAVTTPTQAHPNRAPQPEPPAYSPPKNTSSDDGSRSLFGFGFGDSGGGGIDLTPWSDSSSPWTGGGGESGGGGASGSW